MFSDMVPRMYCYSVAVKENFYSFTGYADADLFADQIVRDGIFVYSISYGIIKQDSLF